MANDINRVVLVGRLTRDPELKSTPSGSYFCRFSLASNRSIYKKDEPAKDEVGYFDCIAWGKAAEIISKYVQKGRRIGIDGALRYSSWETNEGQKRSKVEVHINNFQFLDPKSDESSPHQPGNPDNYEPVPTTDDEIPF